MPGSDLTTRDLAALRSPVELMERQWAPCRHACPVHADVRKYLEHIAAGQWREAIDVIRDRLPYAAVCGRVCHHPCETNCRRGDVDGAVAIRELKRFVAESQGAGGATVHKAARQDKASVAIVGSGPAGMTAALDLARLGYRPVVFEKDAVAGGMPMTAVPQYRLPGEVLQMDIDWIVAHGVEIRTGERIGEGRTIQDLRREGFAAVLISTGLSSSRMLDLPGVKHPRVFPVLEFLRSARRGEALDIGQDVLVIGGGNVAMDAARSALRLGAAKVRAMCLESAEEMPAWEWEKREALEEGVAFIHRRGPVEIVVKEGRIVGVRARKVTAVFDAAKRFNPTYDDSDVIDIECDTVVFAIGQSANGDFLRGSGLDADARGRLAWNAATHQTSRPDVFAAGEIVTPPGAVVEACANGRRAGAAIDMFLSGKPIVLDDLLPDKIDKIPPSVGEKVIRAARAEAPSEPPQRRRASFDEVDHALSGEACAREARRCMGCGGGAEVLADKCAACLTCLRVCPFGIPKVADVARIDSAQCQACGICVAECPANAIIWRSREPDELAALARAAMANLPAGGRKTLAYVGGYRASPSDWRQAAAPACAAAEAAAGAAGANVAQHGPPANAAVYLHSTSRLGVADILRAFESGADRVVIVCRRDDRYPGVLERTRKRFEQARAMLKEIGFADDRLSLFVDGGENDS
jgi:NADPH-dependent glutamate synthase beta subunit-like oxidoreductase/MinD superfamily P-loop ATPase